MDERADQAGQLEDARAFLARAERAFTASDKQAILDLFSDDVYVVFADFPPMRGKDAYGKFLDARLARQLEYRPRTTVRTVADNVIGASWEATWIDACTGQSMLGRGCEFISLRHGKAVELIVSFNAWNDREGPRTPIV